MNRPSVAEEPRQAFFVKFCEATRISHGFFTARRHRELRPGGGREVHQIPLDKIRGSMASRQGIQHGLQGSTGCLGCVRPSVGFVSCVCANRLQSGRDAFQTASAVARPRGMRAMSFAGSRLGRGCGGAGVYRRQSACAGIDSRSDAFCGAGCADKLRANLATFRCRETTVAPRATGMHRLLLRFLVECLVGPVRRDRRLSVARPPGFSNRARTARPSRRPDAAFNGHDRRRTQDDSAGCVRSAGASRHTRARGRNGSLQQTPGHCRRQRGPASQSRRQSSGYRPHGGRPHDQCPVAVERWRARAAMAGLDGARQRSLLPARGPGRQRPEDRTLGAADGRCGGSHIVEPGRPVYHAADAGRKDRGAAGRNTRAGGGHGDRAGARQIAGSSG